MNVYCDQVCATVTFTQQFINLYSCSIQNYSQKEWRSLQSKNVLKGQIPKSCCNNAYKMFLIMSQSCEVSVNVSMLIAWFRIFDSDS